MKTRLPRQNLSANTAMLPYLSNPDPEPEYRSAVYSMGNKPGDRARRLHGTAITRGAYGGFCRTIHFTMTSMRDESMRRCAARRAESEREVLTVLAGFKRTDHLECVRQCGGS